MRDIPRGGYGGSSRSRRLRFGGLSSSIWARRTTAAPRQSPAPWGQTDYQVLHCFIGRFKHHRLANRDSKDRQPPNRPRLRRSSRHHFGASKRRPFLNAKRLLSNQTFRDIYRTDTLGVDQRLKITSLTFLLTDLKGSTELYERVGDLAAFDLVREHFRTLNDIVATEGGAVVKTIGDAVMATFLTPDHALAAALKMREAMRRLNETHGREDLLLKIGIHEGPCLAVSLNERQDYFGQTVNIASRVQGLAMSRSILATAPVVHNPR